MPGKAGARKSSERVRRGKRAIKTTPEGKDGHLGPSKRFAQSHLALGRRGTIGNMREDPTRHWIGVESFPKARGAR